MNVKKICLISLFILFLILSTSSVHANDLDNSTELNSELQDNDIIADDENSSENPVIDDGYFSSLGEWTVDENGKITYIPSAKNNTYANYSVEFHKENVTDLRKNNSEDIDLIQRYPPTDLSSMIDLWNELVNDPGRFDGKYPPIHDNITINWEDYAENNDSCHTPYSKEFLDFLKFVNENKVKPASIESEDINVFYSKDNMYKVRILNPVSDSVGKGINVTFIFDGKKINVKTDEDGYASFRFDSQPGTHAVNVYAGNITSKNKITVKSLFKTKNINKAYKKSSQFSVKIIKPKGKSLSKQTVKITFKGKNYKIKTNSKGIAKFNIPKNLKIGKHVIKTSYNGCSVKNMITVKR